MARLAGVLDEWPNQVAAACLKFMLLTGCRKGEALSMRWEDINFEDRVWTKPSHHTKQRKIHRVPLSNAALEILEEIGIPTIGRHIKGLIERLATGLVDFGAEVYPPPEMRHHILTFTHPDAERARLLETLTEQGFVISRRRGRIRVSPHLYNTKDEIDLLLSSVERCLTSA